MDHFDESKFESDKSKTDSLKSKNSEKNTFFKFLMYNTKIEINFEDLNEKIWWSSLLEASIWIFLFIVFCLNPSSLMIIWVFSPHFIRAIFGLIILMKVPNTFHVVEQLKDYENQSVQEVQDMMINVYKSLLSVFEEHLKKYLIGYFVLTIINVLIDAIMFIILLYYWGGSENSLFFVAVLIMIVIFYCNYFSQISM